MGKTQKTGYLQNIVSYDASGNVILPANLTVLGTITGYATSSSLTGYVTLSTLQTITGIKTFSNEALFGNGITITDGYISINSGSNIVTLDSAVLTANRAILLPDASGTIALTSDIPSLTGYATESYVSTAVSNLVNSAPAALDTLSELATALGNDANFATTIATSIGTKEPAITAGTTAQYWRGDKTWQTLPTYTLSGLGGVPTSRTLTINGVAYDLTADRSWSIAAGVTSFNTRTGAITLSSSDVTTALGYTPYNGATNPNGYITGVTNITGYAAMLNTSDTRTISPSSHTSYRLTFGFTSWANNNTPDWADYLHLRSYGDSSGGADNLIMFKKNGIGMRIWQQSFGSSTAYSSYADVLHSGNYSSYALPISGGTITGTSLQVGTAFSYDNPGGWNANIVAAGINHARFRLRATSYNSSGDRESYFWLDNSVSPATGIYSSASSFNFNGSITTVQIAGNTILHAGNYSSYRGTQLISPNGGTVVAADSALPDAGHSFIHTLALGPGGNDGHILGMTWANTTTSYGAQIWIDTDPTNTMAFRSRSNSGSWTGWNTIIHSNNIGSQSVNYANSSGSASSASYAAYLPTLYAGGQQTNPQVYFNDGIGLRAAMTGSWSVWSDTLWVNGYSGSDVRWMCALHFLRNSEPRMAISAQQSNSSSYGGYYEVHTDYNFSRTSPTFSGQVNAASFRLANGFTISQGGSNYASFNSWTFLAGYHGLYSSYGGGAHIFPNDGAYGSWGINGSKNSWQGFEFKSGQDTVNLMVHTNANDSGFYNQRAGWQFRWSGGTMYIYKNGYGGGTEAVALDSSNWSSYVNGSDERKKENVRTLTNALDKVMQLNGVTYSWIKDITGKREVGLLAQQVEKVLPEVVHYDELEDMYSVKYGNITALLIEAVKEQQVKIEELKSIINGFAK